MPVARAPKLPSDLNQSGLAANRPAAAADNTGVVFFATDTGVISRSDGSTWTAFGADPSVQRASQNGVWRPRHHNLVAWTYPPLNATAGLAPTAGVMMVSRINVAESITFSNVVMNCTVLAVTPANCVVAVYDRAKTLIGKSADISSQLTATLGEKVFALTGAPFTKTGGTVETTGTDEFVWVGIVIGSAGTLPQFARNLALANMLGIGITANTAALNGTSGSALTDAPSPIGTIASGGTNVFWFGLRT